MTACAGYVHATRQNRIPKKKFAQDTLFLAERVVSRKYSGLGQGGKEVCVGLCRRAAAGALFTADQAKYGQQNKQGDSLIHCELQVIQGSASLLSNSVRGV